MPRKHNRNRSRLAIALAALVALALGLLAAFHIAEHFPWSGLG